MLWGMRLKEALAGLLSLAFVVLHVRVAYYRTAYATRPDQWGEPRPILPFEDFPKEDYNIQPKLERPI